MTSLGTGFDLLLARGALCALAVAALWGVFVVGATATEALTSGRIQLASRVGCPTAVRAWLVGVFLALFAGVAPAQAGDTGSGGPAGADLTAAVDGLPLPDRTVGSTPRGPRTYVVHPGDSLWSIARHYLGTDASDRAVAAAVDRLYAANRSVIGPDRDLLMPGQRLRTPSLDHRIDRSTHQEER